MHIVVAFGSRVDSVNQVSCTISYRFYLSACEESFIITRQQQCDLLGLAHNTRVVYGRATKL